MDETQARAVLLVRALETTDTDRAAAFSDDDRRYASRAALELARWDAARQAAPPSPALYLAKRAELLLGKLPSRGSQALRAARRWHWPRWLDAALPLAALVLGAASEQVADRGRVNLLAFPLLAIVAWNLAVYLGLLLRPLLARAPDGSVRLPTLLRLLAQAATPRALPNDAWAAPVARYIVDWTRAGGPLKIARAARVLHLAAFAFALGAVAALYLRALAFEYRVGWESTFLQAAEVQRWLAWLLLPASGLTGLPLPTVDEVEALRFTGSAPGGAAARWIHLYAATVALFVLLPRLALALWAQLRAWQMARNIPVDLAEPYFRRLLAGFAPGPQRLRVIPYSYTPDEAALDGLRALARRLLGDEAELVLRPAIGYGAEAQAAAGLQADDPQTAATLVLASLAATPERENLGLLLDTLARALPRPPALLVDESAYRRRLGSGGAERLAERGSAWRAFADARGTPLATLDLAAPLTAAADDQLAPLLDSAPAAA